MGSSSALLLKVAQVYDHHRAIDATPSEALLATRREVGDDAGTLLQTLEGLVSAAPSENGPVEVTVAHLSVGMVLADDVRTTSGMLLASRGYEVTAGFIERIRNFASNLDGGIHVCRPRGGSTPEAPRF